MSRIANGKYNTVNQFGDYTDLVNEYLNKIYGSSLELYIIRYYKNNPTGTHKIDIEKIEESLGYLEDYLYYYYQFNNESFVSIFTTLIDDLQYITVLPPEKRGIFGQYVSSEKAVYINPQLRAGSYLTSDERTRLHICHELGHIINSKWMEKIVPILNSLKCSNEDRQLMYDGFSLLDETTTQDRAENIAYYFSNKTRPQKFRYSTRLFDGRPFETNFDYYGEFQVPVIAFARTFRGIGKLLDDELVMQEFNKRSLSEDFSSRIIDEYTQDGQIDNLHYMLKRLGIIKNASYAAFGYSEQKYLRQSSVALDEYNQLVGKMRDYRDPITKN
ncbi:MAG: hypothetical protein IKZ96_00605 [Bacilli bacterium]|nr:hypothetical protein [Bacilli bacterium]